MLAKKLQEKFAADAHDRASLGKRLLRRRPERFLCRLLLRLARLAIPFLNGFILCGAKMKEWEGAYRHSML